MATIYSANTIRDNLILFLDPATIRSYPNSGTTFYDISGNSKNFTIVGNLQASNYFINFDGASNYANSSSSIITSPTTMSFFCFVYIFFR